MSFSRRTGNPLALSPGVAPRRNGHESGGYAMLQQQISTRDGDRARGLTVFGNFVQADRDTAVIDQVITVGLFYNGYSMRARRTNSASRSAAPMSIPA
jgi:porin